MAYKGSYVRNKTTNSVKSSKRNWGTGVDPGHSVSAMGSDQGFPALTSPNLPDVPNDIVDEYNPSGTNAVPNLPAPEREPKGHMGAGAPPRTSNKYDEIRSDTKRHEENYGGTLKDTAAMVMRSVFATFGTPRLQSLDLATDDQSASATGAARRALRGFNSLKQNNPGSAEVNYSGNYTRRGWEISRLTDRPMPRRKLTHDYRPVYVNTATIAHVTNGPQGQNYSPYGSPYRSVARVTSGTERPMARREPRPWDESAITDGSEDMYAQDTSQYSSWAL